MSDGENNFRGGELKFCGRVWSFCRGINKSKEAHPNWNALLDIMS
jgi:hypothetical protein